MTTKQTGEERRTAAAFFVYRGSREPGLYAHMFMEDVQNGLMGFRHVAGNEGRHIEIAGDEAGKTALRSLCTSISDYPGYELEDVAHTAIESIGRQIAWFGEAIYEICGSGSGLCLFSVSPHGLFRVPGGFVQFIPKRGRQWTGGRAYTFLPKSCTWIVRLPRRRFGGPSAYRRLLNQLTAVSNLAPDFWTRDLQAGKMPKEFNVADYNRIRDAYIAKITRRWGWNQRDSTGKYSTEFFYFFRSLRFRQSQAILRNHIVDVINKFLATRGINAHIRLEGFPSAEDIGNLVSQVSAGSEHYATALKRVR